MKFILFTILLTIYSNIHSQTFTDEETKIIMGFFEAAKKKTFVDPGAAIIDFNKLIEIAPNVTIFYLHRADAKFYLNLEKNIPGTNDIINDYNVFINNPQGQDKMVPFAHISKGITYITMNNKIEGCREISPYKEYMVEGYKNIFDKNCLNNSEFTNDEKAAALWFFSLDNNSPKKCSWCNKELENGKGFSTSKSSGCKSPTLDSYSGKYCTPKCAVEACWNSK
jgi:hypothetical protein